MKYKYAVKAYGKYYKAGEEVPEIEEPLLNEINVEETKTNVYTSSELSEMKAGEIKKLGAELGYKITAVKQTDCMKQFLEQQNK